MNKFNQHQQGKDDQQLQSHFLFNRSPSDYVLNHFCTRFAPLQEFFATQHPLLIRKPTPTYSQTISKAYRNNLKPDRQLQYLRRAIAHDYCDSVTRAMLVDREYQPYCKAGNISLCSDGRLLWAEGTKVLGLVLDEVLSIQSESKLSSVSLNQTKQLLDIHEIILELKFVQGQILVRSSRMIFLFDPDRARETLVSYTFDQEVIAVWCYHSQGSLQLFVSLSDGQTNRIKHIGIEQKTQSILFQMASHIPFHSGWCLTRDQSILCDESKVYAYDARMKKNSTLSTIQLQQNRIFTGIPLDLSSINRCFALAQSFEVGFYDLRKPSSAVLQMPHYCQESPPTILQLLHSHPQVLNSRKQFIGSLLSSKDQNPILIAHSPYNQGSGLFAELQDGWVDSRSSSSKFHRTTGFQILFDRGKIDSNFWPRSLSAISLNNHVYFFSVDNMSGVALQIFKRESAGKKILERKKSEATAESRLERLRFGKNIELEESANNAWFRRQALIKYVKQKEERYWEKQLFEEEMDLEITNSVLEERYLRFADLKQFYHELFRQAQTNNPSHQVQKENTRISEFLRQEAQHPSYPSIETTLASSLQEEDSKEIPQADCLSFGQLLELHEDWQKD